MDDRRFDDEPLRIDLVKVLASEENEELDRRLI